MTSNEFNNNGFEYVDLELPSGTLWAACNVGANRPSDFGLYFQWGDTQGYTADQVGTDEGQKKFYWTDYKWNPSGDGETFTKYASPGLSLDLDDDAANANMGGDWHIPSPKQIQELIDNTTNSWATQDNVRGIKFTSKKDTSKHIFIPAAGIVLVGLVCGIGNFECSIWSSMLNNEHIEYAQTYFDAHLDYTGRVCGIPVRGVIG